MRHFIGWPILLAVCLFGAVSTASPADTPADSNIAVILLNNGASITGHIVVDEPGRPVVIIRKSDGMRFELPRKKIFRITDPEHFDEVRAEYDSRPKKKRLFHDPEIWTYAGVAWGESELNFCGDALGLYRAGERYRIGLGVGYSFEEDGILILVTHAQRDFGKAAVRFNLFGEAGYTLRFDENEYVGGGNGGLMLSAGVSFRGFFQGKVDWLGRIGYRYLGLGECAPAEGSANRHYLIAQLGFAF